jgi:hypothetical protein
LVVQVGVVVNCLHDGSLVWSLRIGMGRVRG